MLRRQFTVLILILSITTLSFKCGGDLANRAIKAIGAVPAVVRILFPGADPRVFDALEAANAAFQQFLANRTGTNWQKAEAAWNAAKPLLLRFGNSRIAAIVAVIDLLLGQVTIPTGDMASDAGVEVKFKEADVHALEKLVNEK